MTEEIRIQLVASDTVLRRALADQLTGLGYRVARTAGSRLARDAQLLLVGDAAAKGDVAALCQSWRKAAPGGPVVILAGSADEAPSLLASGADACLTKPVRLGELAACLESVLRGRASRAELRFGPFRLLTSSRQVINGAGRHVPVTEKETAILAYLHRQNGRVVPRAELLDEVWGYAETVATHTLETHIYRLRRKLRRIGAAPALLGEEGGYRLAEPRSAPPRSTSARR